MNQHQTIMEASSFSQMMDTCTFLLEMVECPEIHLGNMGMLRISKNSLSTDSSHVKMPFYICHKSVMRRFR